MAEFPFDRTESERFSIEGRIFEFVSRSFGIFFLGGGGFPGNFFHGRFLYRFWRLGFADVFGGEENAIVFVLKTSAAFQKAAVLFLQGREHSFELFGADKGSLAEEAARFFPGGVAIVFFLLSHYGFSHPCSIIPTDECFTRVPISLKAKRAFSVNVGNGRLLSRRRQGSGA
jgi:hypothetical protein